jgi:hypothetical protein
VGGIPSLIIVLLAAAPAILPDEDSPQWEVVLQRTAEKAFRDGTALRADPQSAREARTAFVVAARFYQQLEERGCRTAALCRNLGNAYLLADDLPHAILAYRRGLRLTPTDLEMRRNLNYAREQVAFKPQSTLGRPPVEHRPPWLPRVPDTAAWLVFALYAFGWLAGARWWMARRSGWLTVTGACFAAASLVALALAWQSWGDHQEEAQPLVVIARDDVLLRRGNGEAYPPRFQTPLPRGVEARRRFERGDWLQIELSGGEIGWVKRGDVLEDRK